MKKKIIEIGKLTIALAVLVLFVSTASAQPEATDLGVNDISGDPGTFVLVPVNITNVQNEPIAGIVFDISFDSTVINLTKVNVKKGDLTSEWDSPGYNPINSRIQIVYGGSGTEIPLGGSGSVVVLNFSVVGVSGAKSAINISGIQLSGLEGALGTATANNGTFIITGQAVVEKNLTTIAVSPQTATLTAGATQTFTATAMDQNNVSMAGVNITFASDNTTVGTVVPKTTVTDANGSAATTFTALAAGTASVSAATGNVTGSANVTVSIVVDHNILTKIAVSPPTATLTTGATQIFTATAMDQNNVPMAGVNITFASDNSTVGTVAPETTVTDANGSAATTFTALTAGTASVSAATGNVMGKANVTVSPPSPQSSMVNATREIEKESLGKGESTKITIRINSNIIQGLSLSESIPAGSNLTRISDDADGFKSSTNEWVWSNVMPGITKTVIYVITAPKDATIGTYYINGTISNSSGVIAIVGGNNAITLDILAYYRGLGNDPDRVETTDLLKAMDDWRSKKVPTGFAHPITILELSALINEWTLS